MEKYVELNLENMKADLGKLVSFNSVDESDKVAPFGQANRDVLDCALGLMENAGLKTKNLDYYCGYGEVGQGEKLIGIVAHLDIVPAGEGWETNPFEMVEKDGYLYGRGVSDDKGAAIASLYALKYLIDTKYEFKKRVRLILGCNEETGSLCMKHYTEVEGHPDVGFTPDGNFPGIYAEKGTIGGNLSGKADSILSIKGGEARNVVCKKVIADLKIGDVEAFKLYLNEHNIKFEMCEDNGTYHVTVYGVAAHASTPDLGVNAINHLMEALYASGNRENFVVNFHKYLGLTVHGELLGYEELADDISNTSINMGVIYKDGENVVCTLDMRFPVKTTSAKAMAKVVALNDNGCSFVGGGHEPLYFDLNNPMIKSYMEAYQEVTGDYKSQMEAIGGGTYAKSVHNIIAFGCEFQGEDNHIHDCNEKLAIESFKKQVLIYIKAIQKLNEVE